MTITNSSQISQVVRGLPEHGTMLVARVGRAEIRAARNRYASGFALMVCGADGQRYNVAGVQSSREPLAPQLQRAAQYINKYQLS